MCQHLVFLANFENTEQTGNTAPCRKVVEIRLDLSSRSDWWPKRCPIIVSMMCIFGILVVMHRTAHGGPIAECLYIYIYAHMYIWKYLWFGEAELQRLTTQRHHTRFVKWLAWLTQARVPHMWLPFGATWPQGIRLHKQVIQIRPTDFPFLLFPSI